MAAEPGIGSIISSGGKKGEPDRQGILPGNLDSRAGVIIFLTHFLSKTAGLPAYRQYGTGCRD